MDKAGNIKEALEWFLSHAEGTLNCYRETEDGIATKICNSYPEAEAFFSSFSKETT